MSDITVRCRICWALPSEPHSAGCPIQGPPHAPEPTAEERAELLEALRARQLEAWLRGGPVPRNRGGKPREEKDLP